MQTRHSVRIILINDADEVLLMRGDDPNITDLNGKPRGPFWFLIGGGAEPAESVQETALREIFEETGIPKEAITLGPVVWYNALKFNFHGVPTHLQQKFLVARTTEISISFAHFTEQEKRVIQEVAWFSLEKMKKWPEVIFPTTLLEHLPDIIAGKYPHKPFEIH